jgi:hypothetical protein
MKFFGWIVSATVFVTLLANLTRIHCRDIHGVNFSALAAFAPNQFLYPLYVFPFAAVFCFITAYCLYWRVATILVRGSRPLSSPAAFLLSNPSVPFVLSVVASAVTVFFVFEYGQWTFDKLKPAYAARALQSLADIDMSLEDRTKFEEVELERKKQIQKARRTIEAAAANPNFSLTEVNNLNSWEFLLLVRDVNLPVRLDMFDRGMLFLNVIQAFTIFTVFFSIIFQALMCFLLGDFAAHTHNSPETLWLREGTIAALCGVAFAASFAVFYKLLNVNVKLYSGDRSTAALDLFVIGLTVLLSFILIRYGLQTKLTTFTIEKNWLRILSLLPSVFLVTLFVIAETFFGRDVSDQTRTLGCIALVILGCGACWWVLSRDLPYTD